MPKPSCNFTPSVLQDHRLRLHHYFSVSFDHQHHYCAMNYVFFSKKNCWNMQRTAEKMQWVNRKTLSIATITWPLLELFRCKVDRLLFQPWKFECSTIFVFLQHIVLSIRFAKTLRPSARLCTGWFGTMAPSPQDMTNVCCFFLGGCFHFHCQNLLKHASRLLKTQRFSMVWQFYNMICVRFTTTASPWRTWRSTASSWRRWKTPRRRFVHILPSIRLSRRNRRRKERCMSSMLQRWSRRWMPLRLSAMAKWGSRPMDRLSATSSRWIVASCQTPCPSIGPMWASWCRRNSRTRKLPRRTTSPWWSGSRPRTGSRMVSPTMHRCSPQMRCFMHWCWKWVRESTLSRRMRNSESGLTFCAATLWSSNNMIPRNRCSGGPSISGKSSERTMIFWQGLRCRNSLSSSHSKRQRSRKDRCKAPGRRPQFCRRRFCLIYGVQMSNFRLWAVAKTEPVVAKWSSS